MVLNAALALQIEPYLGALRDLIQNAATRLGVPNPITSLDDYDSEASHKRRRIVTQRAETSIRTPAQESVLHMVRQQPPCDQTTVTAAESGACLEWAGILHPASVVGNHRS